MGGDINLLASASVQSQGALSFEPAGFACLPPVQREVDMIFGKGVCHLVYSDSVLWSVHRNTLPVQLHYTLNSMQSQGPKSKWTKGWVSYRLVLERFSGKWVGARFGKQTHLHYKKDYNQSVREMGNFSCHWVNTKMEEVSLGMRRYVDF